MASIIASEPTTSHCALQAVGKQDELKQTERPIYSSFIYKFVVHLSTPCALHSAIILTAPMPEKLQRTVIIVQKVRATPQPRALPTEVCAVLEVIM